MRAASLRETIGPRAFDRLVSRFGGRRVYVPKLDHAARDARICNLHATTDFKVGGIAKMFGLSRRRAYEILKRERARHPGQATAQPPTPTEAANDRPNRTRAVSGACSEVEIIRAFLFRLAEKER